ELRDALKGNNVDQIRSARERLEQAWAPLASSLYSQAGAGQETAGAASGSTETGTRPPDDDVVDAEFRSHDED
ncbi:MAG TPA: molecular chaperone DnaK, partial [Chloroflexota bacterium]